MGTLANLPITELAAHIRISYNPVSYGLMIIGLYIVLLGPVSFLIHEQIHIAPTFAAFIMGIISGPLALDWINPLRWTNGNEHSLNELSWQIARNIIALEVLFVGLELPARYIWKERRAVGLLLGPLMTMGWFICAGLVYAFVPGLTYLESLCISACITPTDPVLANAIVHGLYAEKHVPEHVRHLISCEAGANDGLGYPFIYLSLYLMTRVSTDGSLPDSSIGEVVKYWVVGTWLYQICCAIAIGGVIGAVAGWCARTTEGKSWVMGEYRAIYGVGMTFIVLGLTGILAMDDIFACFVCGVAFKWTNSPPEQLDDLEDHELKDFDIPRPPLAGELKIETDPKNFGKIVTDETVAPVTPSTAPVQRCAAPAHVGHTNREIFQDHLAVVLNIMIFIYIGAIVPWAAYSSHIPEEVEANNIDVIHEMDMIRGLLDVKRLVALAVCVLLVRRLPVVLGMWYFGALNTLKSFKEAVLVGYFGPIGVSAIYFAILGMERLPENRTRLRAVILPVILFIVTSSCVTFGLTITILQFAKREWKILRHDGLWTKKHWKRTLTFRTMSLRRTKSRM